MAEGGGKSRKIPHKERQSCSDVDFVATRCISKDLLEDWMFILAEENMSRIEKAKELNGMWIHPKVSEFVFTACDQFGLPREVKFQALILLDEYHVRYWLKMQDKIMYNNDFRRQQKSEFWKELLEKISSQLPLRALSCIQIASKLFSYYECITVSAVDKYMRSLSHVLKSDLIVKSELRVFTQLHYKVSKHNPLVYVETVLKLMPDVMSNCSGTLLSCWYRWSIFVLEAVFMNRNNLYQSLMCRVTNVSNIQTQKTRLACIMSDYMLLACGTISAAAYLIKPKLDNFQDVPEYLHKITKGPTDDYYDLCAVILEHILTKGKPLHHTFKQIMSLKNDDESTKEPRENSNCLSVRTDSGV